MRKLTFRAFEFILLGSLEGPEEEGLALEAAESSIVATERFPF